MAGLGDLWPYAKNWWGTTAAVVTLAAAVYYFPKKMLTTYDWYLDRWWDSHVRKELEDRRTEPKQLQGGSFREWGRPVTVSELSQATGFSEKRVTACLARLAKNGGAIKDGEAWKAIDKTS